MMVLLWISKVILDRVMDRGIQIVVEDTSEALIRKALQLFARFADEGVREKDRFFVALSGGSTPVPMYRKMGEEPWRSAIPWNRTHIFWVDERCVPVRDPASNYGAAKGDFVGRIPIPPAQIHPMPGDLDPAEGAERYEAGLIGCFGLKPREFPVFDLVLLGLGRDGHTASLFPGQTSLDEDERLVISVTGGEPFLPRLTLTFPVINHARHAIFLVSGKGKADILRAVLDDKDETRPARRVRPGNGDVTWLLDRDAASMLSKGVLHEHSS